jgi:hypothetical protein
MNLARRLFAFTNCRVVAANYVFSGHWN